MPHTFKKVSGNYVDICNLNPFFSSFVGKTSKKENDSQIEKDLHRVCFVDLNEKTIDAFKSTWRGEDGTVVNPTYTQGNTSGGPFAKISMDFGIMDKHPDMFYENALRSLNFGYFDDSGQMSGFSLTYHKDNPSWWAISIMSNNPLSPQERSLSFFYNNEISDFFQNSVNHQDVHEDSVRTDVLQTIHSTNIQRLLATILNEHGEINVEEIEKLDSRIQTNRNIDDRDRKKVLLNYTINKLLELHPEDSTLKTFITNIKKRAVEDIDFYQDANFLPILDDIEQKILISQPALPQDINPYNPNIKNLEWNELLKTVFMRNMECFKSTLTKKQQGTDAEIKFYQQGLALYNYIQNKIASNPDALKSFKNSDLTTLNAVVETATYALNFPNDGDNLAKLDTLRKEVSNKSPRFWKGLGTILLGFISTALIVAGVLGAIPTGGVSLMVAAAGMTALLAASGTFFYKGRESGFAKSLSLFKQKSQAISKSQPATPDTSLSTDDEHSLDSSEGSDRSGPNQKF